jgi:ABC-type lipoprotein export system ATPase subunit
MADPLRRAANPTPPQVIRAVNLHKVYTRGRERVEALRGVDLEVARGAFVVVRGPSGSGKSTLLHLLGGIDRPSRGSVLVNGTSLETAGERELTRFRRDHVGFIFQFYNLLPSIPALDNVILPLLAQSWPYAKARRRGAEMLAQVGLEGRWDHLPAELSGGEQQRVAIARALIVEPVIVLADEPTGDLDSESARGVMDLMSELNRRSGTTFVVATHNPELAARADRTFDLRDGRLQPGRGET